MRILIVDDEPRIRAALRRGFNSDIEIVEANDGLDAWMLIQDYQGDFDVVFSDMDMPIMEGRELYELIKEVYPELAKRVVFQTGNAIKYGGWVKKQGQPLLCKPYRFDDVLDVVQLLRPSPQSVTYPLLKDGRGISVA